MILLGLKLSGSILVGIVLLTGILRFKEHSEPKNISECRLSLMVEQDELLSVTETLILKAVITLVIRFYYEVKLLFVFTSFPVFRITQSAVYFGPLIYLLINERYSSRIAISPMQLWCTRFFFFSSHRGVHVVLQTA